MRDRGARLREIFDGLSETQITWGVDDCSAVPARWVAERTGRQVWTPPYRSEAQAAALVSQAGGLAALWDEIATAHRLRTLALGAEPVEIGDVGIMQTRLSGEVGGIFLHGGILMVRCNDGVRTFWPRAGAMVAAWRVP